MSQRRVSRRRLFKVSTGDLRERVKIEVRVTKPPQYGSGEYQESYTELNEVWAKVETLGFQIGVKEFNEVNIEDRPSHRFTIRHIAGINSFDHRIRYRSEFYEIIRPSNPEERNEYLTLYCKKVGNDSLGANQ